MMTNTNGRSAGVEAVDRALVILKSFSDASPKQTLTELTTRAGLPKSTVLRLTKSLVRQGFLSRDESGIFRLGSAVWQLGHVYDRALDLSAFVRPALARLMAKTTETAAFYVRAGDLRVCLYRHDCAHPIGPRNVHEGTQLPLDRGAAGHVLLAYTDEPGPLYDGIRRNGFYLTIGERDPHSAGIAAPVFGAGDRFVGTISVVGPRSRLEPTIHTTIKEAVTDAAAELSPDFSPHGR